MSDPPVEVEVKVRVSDPHLFRKNLKNSGARFLGSERQRDIYLTHPCRDLAGSDEALRIRVVSGRRYLTYKGPKLGKVGKSRVEVEVGVDEGIEKIFHSLGFGVAGVVEKERSLYALGDVSVCLDRVEGLGWFAEAEARGGDVSREEELLQLLRSLGGGENIRLSYLELLFKETL